MERLYKNIRNNLTAKIREEYENYHTKHIIYDLIKSKNLTDVAQLKKDLAYIETYMFNRINYSIYDKAYPYHSYKLIGEDEQRYNISYSSESLPYMQELIDLINHRALQIKEVTTYKPTVVISKTHLYVHDLKIELDDRIKFLINHAIEQTKLYNPAYDNTLSLTIGVKLVVRCLLRYCGLGITGNQCSLSRDIYDYVYKKMNVRGEGFCSPLNSKLIEKKNTKICTLFKDTDKYFKSLGAFTKDTMIKYNKHNWILNPPFTSSATKLSLKAIENTLGTVENDMLIILVIPLTKMEFKQNVFNSFLFGYISQKEICIIDKKMNKKIKIPRKDTSQYFICNGVFSKNFADVYMFFYTNNDNDYTDDIIKLSELWTIKNLTDVQQSNFKEPIRIVASDAT